MDTMLTTAEVKDCLSQQSTDSIAELQGLGNTLLTEVLDRNKHLDTKASSVAGYGGVIAALLVGALAPNISVVLSDPLRLGLFIFGGLFLIAATVQALLVLWVKDYDWFSDNELQQQFQDIYGYALGAVIVNSWGR